MRRIISAVAIIIIYLIESAQAEPKRVLSGEFEYGEKYTAVLVDSEDEETARDDEEFDVYRFKSSWAQYDQPLTGKNSLSLRTQRVEREYESRPQLDNNSTYGQLRMNIEPSEGWAIWPKVSARRRDYETRTLDNTIFSAGIDARYRWGIRDNVRFGVSYESADYDDENYRNRDHGAAHIGFEKPVSEALTFRVRGRVQTTNFASQTATRRNATSGSGAAGFRWEF